MSIRSAPCSVQASTCTQNGLPLMCTQANHLRAQRRKGWQRNDCVVLKATTQVRLAAQTDEAQTAVVCAANDESVSLCLLLVFSITLHCLLSPIEKLDKKPGCHCQHGSYLTTFICCRINHNIGVRVIKDASDSPFCSQLA